MVTRIRAAETRKCPRRETARTRNLRPRTAGGSPTDSLYAWSVTSVPENEEAVPHRSRIEHRTSQLPVWSRILYRIEHYTALPAIALVATLGVVALVVVISLLGYPKNGVDAFELCVSAITLIMVFAIQHTAGREQAATQRKLDELIRAFPGANESLMMLEEAPREVMLDVEDEQRTVRLNSPDTNGT